ncbi:MAG: PGPGW domain-containing protein [Candidatus Omnitrophota bacterium]
MKIKEAMEYTWKPFRKIAILIAGSVVILVGVILLFTPGPALVVIPAGVAILSIEFKWAKRLFRKIKYLAYRLLQWIKQRLRKFRRSDSNAYKKEQ